MKTILIGLFIFIFILCFSTSIQASIEVGNLSHKISGYYGAGAQIDGWINLSIDKEDTDILFKDSLGSQIELLNLIKNISGVEYSCLPIDCNTRYTASLPENSKTINLKKDFSTILGLKIDGEIKGITSIEFEIESDAPESCENQLKIDFFADDDIEISNNKSSKNNCLIKSSYGCFDTSKTAKEYTVEALIPYCQKITLPESPNFEVGAWVKRVSGDLNLTMWLHDEYGIPISEANCKLPKASFAGGEISCLINYSNKEPRDYFLCLTPETEIAGEYKIRGYTDGEALCGFHEIPSQNTRLSASYQIYIKSKKFGQIGTMTIGNVIALEDKLSYRANDYLIEKYGEFSSEYPEDGYVIPIKLISSIDQNIKLDNLEIKYNDIGGAVSTNLFFDITKSPAKISTDGFQKFSLEGANFFVTEKSEKIDYKIEIGDTEIFEEEISIESVPIINGILPSSTVLGYPTNFKIDLNSTKNISSYFIDFGDGKNITSKNNLISHTYNESGSYTIIVSVIDRNNHTISKSFSLSVDTPESFIESLINESQINLENIKEQISGYPKFYQESLNEALDFVSYEDKLEGFQKEFSQTYGDEKELFNLVSKMLNFSAPESIAMIEEAKNMIFYPQSENINLEYLIEITGGTMPENNQEYIDGILGWSQENMDIKIDYLRFSVKTKNEVKYLVSFFETTIKKIKSDSRDPVLIINKMDGLNFESNAMVDTKNVNYATIKLPTEEKKILFSTKADVNFETVPMFVSLPIDYIPIGSSNNNETYSDNPKWLILVLILIFLIILGFIAYITLQIWYKKKYEKYLFPNKTDLYNLVSFVQMSRKKGLSESEIKNKLSSSGWNGERIAYAMKKHSGKRTGMIELPIGPIANIFSKKEKISKKNIMQIRRPRLRPIINKHKLQNKSTSKRIPIKKQNNLSKDDKNLFKR